MRTPSICSVREPNPNSGPFPSREMAARGEVERDQERVEEAGRFRQPREPKSPEQPNRQELTDQAYSSGRKQPLIVERVTKWCASKWNSVAPGERPNSANTRLYVPIRLGVIHLAVPPQCPPRAGLILWRSRGVRPVFVSLYRSIFPTVSSSRWADGVCWT